MKILLYLLLCGSFVSVLASPGSEPSAALPQERSLHGGPHDFSALTGRVGDSCSACHVSHVQGIRQAGGTSGNDSPALELFRIEGQRQVFVSDRYTPGPTSLICLSCHNGTVATSTIGSAHNMLAGVHGGFEGPQGFAASDHPIGIPYPDGYAGYKPRAIVKANHIRLPEGRLECISCHDPHAKTKGLLVTSNRRSALCLSCHVK